MKELKPKYTIGQSVRAEWEGKSIKAKIVDVTVYKKLKFVGYRTDTNQFFREEELSTDIRVGDIVKSEFNGVVSLVTRTGTENADVVELDVANNGSFRLLTDLEFKTLSSDDLMRFVCKDEYPNVSYNVGDFVVASDGRFKGVQEIVSIRKEPDNRIVYLIQNIWCCSNDIKKWIPEVNEKVVITTQLAQINPGSFDGYGMTRYYTVIMKVKELKQDNTVILEDYSSVKVRDLIPLSKYKGN